MDLIQAAKALQKFAGANLTSDAGKRYKLSIGGMTSNDCANALSTFGVNAELLAAAGSMKSVAGQVNVLIHAMGILTLFAPHTPDG